MAMIERDGRVRSTRPWRRIAPAFVVAALCGCAAAARPAPAERPPAPEPRLDGLFRAIVAAARQPTTASWPIVVDVATFDSAAAAQHAAGGPPRDALRDPTSGALVDVPVAALPRDWPAGEPYGSGHALHLRLESLALQGDRATARISIRYLSNRNGRLWMETEVIRLELARAGDAWSLVRRTVEIMT